VTCTPTSCIACANGYGGTPTGGCDTGLMATFFSNQYFYPGTIINTTGVCTMGDYNNMNLCV